MKSIAIIGKAPSSRLLAPYDEPDKWEIWSLSDNYNVLPRWDRWFELHDLDRYKQLYPEYYDWMCAQPGEDNPVYVNDVREEMPSAKLYPLRQMVTKFGSYFTNSISWMIVLALHEIQECMASNPDEETPKIGMWGVDMAQNTEYAHQRPSCEYFMGWARGAGVELVIPDECDLCKTARLYAFDANHGPMDRKIRARQRELSERQQKSRFELEQAERATNTIGGGLAMLEELSPLFNGHADQLKLKATNLQNDLANAKMAAAEMRKRSDMIAGAQEDLSWCRQWA